MKPRPEDDEDKVDDERHEPKGVRLWCNVCDEYTNNQIVEKEDKKLKYVCEDCLEELG